MKMTRLGRHLALILGVLLFAWLLPGCGNSESFVLTSPPPPALGKVQIQLSLQNNRSVKSDVRAFQAVLRQQGTVVLDQTFERSDVGPAQTIELSDVSAGSYELQLLYLGTAESVLGEFRQDISVQAGQTTLITDPNYRNVVPDFTSARNFDAGGGSVFVAVADVNGDTHLDLVSANEGSDNLSVLLGNGNGTFAAAVNFSTDDGPFSVAVADLNGDTNPDLVSANQHGDNLSVLLAR